MRRCLKPAESMTKSLLIIGLIFVSNSAFSSPASEPFIQKWQLGQVSSRVGDPSCLQVADAGFLYLKLQYLKKGADAVESNCRTQVIGEDEAIMACDNASMTGVVDLDKGNFLIGRKGNSGFISQNAKGQKFMLSIDGIKFRWFRTGNFNSKSGLFVIRGVDEEQELREAGRNLSLLPYLCEIRATIQYK